MYAEIRNHDITTVLVREYTTKEKTYILGIRLTPEKFAQIKAVTDSRHLSVSWWVRTLLQKYLEKGQAGGVRLPQGLNCFTVLCSVSCYISRK